MRTKRGPFCITAAAFAIVAVEAANAQPAKVPAAVKTLVTDLREVPAAIPDFTPAPGQKAVQLVLRAGPSGWEATGSKAIPIPIAALTQAEDRNSRRRRPPFGWLVVVPPGGGAPVYWAPVEDPFLVLHEFTGPKGRLSGAKRLTSRGVATARLPFVPGAEVVFVNENGVPHDGWTSFSFTFPNTSIENEFNPLKGGGP